MIPPMSDTAPLIRENTGAHDGAVIGHTRISPCWTSDSWSTAVMTRAGPSATPGAAANPWSSFDSTSPSPPSNSRSHVFTVSVVMPHSMTVNGSFTASGGVPSAGGGCHLRRAWMIRLRSATSAGQWARPRAGVWVAHSASRSYRASYTS